MDGLPEGEEFNRYLKQWLISPTDETCPLGGKAGYSSALKLNGSAVELSHFRTYHTPLKKQSDFINAFAAAQRVAADLSTRIGAEVFPYSLFYVFFDQCESGHLIMNLSLGLLTKFFSRFSHRSYNSRSSLSSLNRCIPSNKSTFRILADRISCSVHSIFISSQCYGSHGNLGNKSKRH